MSSHPKEPGQTRHSSTNPGSDPPAWIETIDDEAAAAGDLAELYNRYRGRRMPHILRSSTLNPPVLKAHDALYRAIMFGPSPLTRVQREMIATVVSLLNHCHY